MARSKHLARGLIGAVFLTTVLHASAADDAAEPPRTGDDAASPAPGATQAAEPEIDWSDWTPAVSVELGFFSHETKTEMDGCFVTVSFVATKQGDCPLLSKKAAIILGAAPGQATFPIEDFRSGTLDGASVPVTFEVTGPTLHNLPGRPRPFAYAGWAFPREGEQQLALSTVPGRAQLDGLFLSDMKFYWFAGIGTDFTVRLGEYDVHLKPALGYLEERIKTTAEIIELDRNDPNIILDNRVSNTDSLRGIGPRLGVDVDLGRRGPIGVSVTAHTMLSFVLNNRSFEYCCFNQDGLPDPNFQVIALQSPPFSIEYDLISYTAGAGLKFRWLGW